MARTIKSPFVEDIKELLRSAKERVVTAINIAMVYTNYEIGRRIVEEEQKGSNRAKYGEEVLQQLSKALTDEFGRGYSYRNLKLIRQFYLIYSNDEIPQSLIAQSQDQIRQTPFAQSQHYPVTKKQRQFFLSWGHYIRLMRISNVDERHFYEIESYTNRWSVREFDRQYDSSLYERLALSRNKEEIKKLSQVGQVIEKPTDAIKNPLVLNFLDLKEESVYSEKELETKIIDKLQDFLMELGKGFTFVKRQMRLSFDEQNFYADLVFYHRFLRCFVVIDLKIGELKHQDIGQMQMYVNYFDRYVKTGDENKTIGILLCKDKNSAIVELTLPEDNDQIFASKYEINLPSKEELKKLLEDKQLLFILFNQCNHSN